MTKTLLFSTKILFFLVTLCFFIYCKKKSNSYNLDISIKNNGTVNYESGKQPIGEIIKLQATPEDGFEFIGWHGDGLDNPTDENPLTLIMDSNKDITANFLDLNNPDYSGMGIWSDEIYGNIIYDIPDELTTGDTSTEAWTKIVTAFVKDAERHGLDLNYVLDGKISYSIKSKIGAGARARGSCRDDEVHTIFNKESHHGTFVKKLKTGDWIYARIDDQGNVNIDKDGDGIAEGEIVWFWKNNFSYNKNGVHFDVPHALKLIWHELGHDILNLDHNCLSNNIMTSSMGTAYHCDQSQIKFNGYFSYYSQDPNLSWQKAVKDMFEGANQWCYDCTKYPGIPKCYGELQVGVNN